MYKTKQEFLELLSDLSDMEQANLGEAINELGYQLTDERVEELEEEITSLERDVEDLKLKTHEQDVTFESIKKLLP